MAMRIIEKATSVCGCVYAYWRDVTDKGAIVSPGDGGWQIHRECREHVEQRSALNAQATRSWDDLMRELAEDEEAAR